jgi:RNA polymerase sigma factor (TIGR02999 family)
MTDNDEVTRIINAVEAGDAAAGEDLLPLVYGELRRLAAQRMANERPGQTLQPTSLVHEAYLRLVHSDPERTPLQWNGRNHFFGAAAEAMRRILIESARRKQTEKHGGHLEKLQFEDGDAIDAGNPAHVLAVDEALEKFAQVEQQKAELVKLRFFAGLTIPEAAAALGISPTTAQRHWVFARAWLGREIIRSL